MSHEQAQASSTFSSGLIGTSNTPHSRHEVVVRSLGDLFDSAFFLSGALSYFARTRPTAKLESD